MPYSTVDDVRVALSRDGAVDRTTAAGLSDEQIEDQITAADAAIDVYVGGRYKVPIVLPDAALEPMRSWSRDIAAYLAADVFRKNRNIPEGAGYVRRYEHTMDQLRTIRDGKGRIDGATVAPPEGAGDSDGDGFGGVTVVNPYDCELFPAREFGLGGGYGW